MKGYSITFNTLPKLHLDPVETDLPKEQHPILWEEIDQMLQKGGIEEVLTPSEGYYSTFFLVPKKDGGQRPVLNLKPLNKFMRVTKFKICTP